MRPLERLAAAGLIIFSLCPAAVAQQPAGAPAQAQATGVGRWCEPQAANFALRYRRIETSQGLITSNEAQDSVLLRARFKFDAAARFTLNAGVATGSTLASGWNSTGLGTGEFSGQLSLKQLYLAAAPLRGMTFEFGGLSAVRGETTEITNLDNDTYLVGERMNLKRPALVWLDDLAVTFAYLGDPSMPGFFRRYRRLSETNYRQYLAAKRVHKRVAVSAEYDRYLAVGTVRSGVSVQLRELRLVDVVRFELYHRMGASPGNGFDLSAEKAVKPRVLLTGGIADIDAQSQIQNGDRYMKGKRVHALGTIRIARGLSAALYFTRAIDTAFPIPNHVRSEVVVAYSAFERRPATK